MPEGKLRILQREGSSGSTHPVSSFLDENMLQAQQQSTKKGHRFDMKDNDVDAFFKPLKEIWDENTIFPPSYKRDENDDKLGDLDEIRVYSKELLQANDVYKDKFGARPRGSQPADFTLPFFHVYKVLVNIDGRSGLIKPEFP
ncbi:hypothetical protein ACFE04_008799 [Oxalis oulophora]